jgi:integrase
MPQSTKGGLRPTHQPKKSNTNTKVQHKQGDVSAMKTEASPALQYWQRELATKGEATKQKYQAYFQEFLEFIGKNPDELIVQRQQDLLNPDRKIQRRIESQLLAFIAKKKKEGYAVATQQLYFASIRSFFEIHYFPLIMRRGDYPKGDSNGVKRATKEAILKVVKNKTRNSVTIKPLILFIKDTGLRVSDVRRLKYGDIASRFERGDRIIQIDIITQKTKLLAKTFMGEESIQALKEYFEARKKGSRNVAPETITRNSPLFKLWARGEVKPIQRHSLSSLIREAFVNVNEERITAHSLRKKLQTDLEKAGINSNWIDHILGHKLINSRDAYSMPTDEELRDAYAKSYQYIRVYPELTASIIETPKQAAPVINANSEEIYEVAEARSLNEVKQLLAKGYKFEMDYGDVKLFTKR